jgi:hypothetical protein
MYHTAGEQLLQALLRYLRACICQALNPPCPPCDDAAVLLACLKVKDCKVVSICDLERTFVLTPVAVRHWLPPINWLGEFIEKICCQPIKLNCGRSSTQESREQSLGAMLSAVARNTRMEDLLAKSFGMTRGDDRKRLMEILTALANLVCSERTAEATKPVAKGEEGSNG